MKDIRISIRLNKEQHIKFKMLAVKKEKSMQDLLIDYVIKEIEKEENRHEKKN